jgi:hypothetical protein
MQEHRAQHKTKGAGRRHKRKYDDLRMKSICPDRSSSKTCMQLVKDVCKGMELNPTSPLLSALTHCSLADPGEAFQSPYSRINEVEVEGEIQNSLHSSGGSTVTFPEVSNSGAF